MIARRRISALLLCAWLAACAAPHAPGPAGDEPARDVSHAVDSATAALASAEPSLGADLELSAFELPEPDDLAPDALAEREAPRAADAHAPRADVTISDQDGAAAAELERFRPVFLLPAPYEQGGGEPALDAFAARDAQVHDVLALLFAGGELGFVLSGEVGGHVSFDIHSTSRADALLELLHHVGLSMDVQAGHVVVAPRGRRRLATPAIPELTTARLADELAGLLEGQGYAVPFADGRIEVEATPDAMARVLARLDVLARPDDPDALLLRPVRTTLGPAPAGLDSRGLGRRELARAMAWRALEDALAQRLASAAVWRDDALALDPRSACADLAGGLMDLARGATAAALPSLERAAEARPDDPLAATARALVDVAEGRDDDAVARLARVHSRWPDPVHAVNLANALMLAGRPDEALDLARRTGGGVPELHLLRAWLFARSEWREAAAGEVDAALRAGAREDDAVLVSVRRRIEALDAAAAADEPEVLDGVRTLYDPGWH